MGDNLEIKKNGSKYEVRVFSGTHGNPNRGKKTKYSTSYYHIFDKNPNLIAQILLDLEIIEGFPISKAVSIYLKKRNNRDFLGF